MNLLALECPSGMVYNAKGSACVTTCKDSKTGKDCHLLAVETCECPGGQVLNNGGQCVAVVSYRIQSIESYIYKSVSLTGDLQGMHIAREHKEYLLTYK